MARIDVIVPVYGVEEYLPKCVESLLAQDFEDFIVTLVDDGSPDGCPALCDRYAAENPGRVRALHKPNGGLSDARNAGVEASDADYVTFVDADDHVSENYLSALYAALESTGADMAVAAVALEFPTRDGGFRHERRPMLPDPVLGHDRALEEICCERALPGYACGKLLRRSLALRYPFPVGRYFEDSFVVYRYVMDCGAVAPAPGAVYYYFQRGGSIQRGAFEKKRMRDHLDAVTEMTALFAREGLPQAIQDAGTYKTFCACYVELYRAAARLSRPAFLEVYGEITPALARTLPALARYARADAHDRLRGAILRRPRLFYAAVALWERGGKESA